MNKELSSYNDLVSKFRELARDLLRMRWINNIKDDLLRLENQFEELSEVKKACLKTIAVTEYRVAQLDEANPSYEDLLVNETKATELTNEEIIRLDESVQELDKQKTKLQEKINKVESGELKIDAENLSVKAKELAEAYVNQRVRELEV